MRRQWIAGALTLALGLGVMSGCAQEEVEQESFTLQVALVGQAERLDPIYATEEVEQTLLRNINDSLMTQVVEDDGTINVEPALAKSVQETDNEDGTTTYTFTLRTAYWSDGQTVGAQDFVYAWRRLAAPSSNSDYASLLSMVVGYDELVTTGDAEALAVSAVDSKTLEVTVQGGTDWFLQEVCTAVATQPVRQDVLLELKESVAAGKTWSSDFTAIVTCGAYGVEAQSAESVTLTINEDYYGTAPKAETIAVLFATDSDTAWSWYEAEEVDFIWPVPEQTYAQLLEYEVDYALGSDLEMVYVAINNQGTALQYELVRQALTQVLDYTAVAEAVGFSALVAQGIVPEGVIEVGLGQSFRQAGPAFDTAEETYQDRLALGELAFVQSAYPVDEAAFVLELAYVDEGDNQAVATELAQQWNTALGITVTPVAMEKSALTQAMEEGTYQLALCTLGALANDPELYLSPWTTTSADNTLGYSDTAYDTLLAIAATAAEVSGRIGCLHDAEALILEEYALIPLYSTQSGWLLNESLIGARRDARGWFDFTAVTPRSL